MFGYQQDAGRERGDVHLGLEGRLEQAGARDDHG